MYRFVDLTKFYWASDEPEDCKPCCAIVDTVTDHFLADAVDSHVLMSLDGVREAAGERGVALVPAGFFDSVAGLGSVPHIGY